MALSGVVLGFISEHAEVPRVQVKRYTYTAPKLVGAGHSAAMCPGCGRAYGGWPPEWGRRVLRPAPWTLWRIGSALTCGACDYKVLVGPLTLPAFVDAEAAW